MKKLLIILAAITLMAASANAAILWDQSTVGWGNPSYWDSQNGCGGFMGQSTVHTASDISIGDEVTVNKITTFYGVMSGDMTYLTEAYLHISLKSGALPTEDVNTTLVPITVTAMDSGDGNWYHKVEADGLAIDLVPGEYWVSLTPANYSVGPAGPNYHLGATDFWGDATASIEYCGMFAPAWFTNHANNDAALLIEGTINVVPTESQNWGGLKAIYR